jgi:hypothetical protein
VLTIEDIASECYGLSDVPGGASVEKKHRVAVLRALYAMLPFEDWHFGKLDRAENMLYLVNYADARSRARLSISRRHARVYGGIDPEAGSSRWFHLEDIDKATILRAIKATNEYLAKDGRGPFYLGPIIEEERRQVKEWEEHRARQPGGDILVRVRADMADTNAALDQEIDMLSWPPAAVPAMMGHNGGPALHDPELAAMLQ